MNIFTRYQHVLITEAYATARAAHTTEREVVEKAVNILVNTVATSGRIVVTGVGKNYSIAHKVSATYSSLGLPSFQLDCFHALHGDLGAVDVITDLVVMISKSGDTKEMVELSEIFDKTNTPVVAITCNPDAQIGQKAFAHLNVPCTHEADHLQLAPSTSSTLLLAVSDALGIAASEMLGWTRKDFLRVHPAGELGRKLRSETEMTRSRKVPTWRK